jgi:hypothetical protein
VYEGVTTCRIAGRSARVRIFHRRRGPATLILRARSLGDGTRVTLRVNGRVIGDVELDATFAEHRLPLAADILRVGANTLDLQQSSSSNHAVEVDHALVVSGADAA